MVRRYFCGRFEFLEACNVVCFFSDGFLSLQSCRKGGALRGYDISKYFPPLVHTITSKKICPRHPRPPPIGPAVQIRAAASTEVPKVVRAERVVPRSWLEHPSYPRVT